MEIRPTIKALFIVYFVSEPESESIKSPESESESERPHNDSAPLEGILSYCYKQGCGVGVETGVVVGRSRPLCLESELKLESVHFFDSDSSPESQCTTRQKTMILAERLSIVSKTLKDRKKRRMVVLK